jgi:CheY-like chemotaxis protein
VLLASPFVDERTTYAAALRDRGYQLREVPDGASLFAAVEAKPPDLIICEMMLPDENALSVSRKLRARSLTSNVPFMIVAGTVDGGLAVGAASMSRTPCPTHVVVKQADTLIAFSRSLGRRALLIPAPIRSG